jgi:protein-disulfide isomerase
MSPVEEDEQDLTRKQRREQSRSQRKAIEEAEAADAQRRKRLIQLGSVAGVVVVIIVVILAATSGGGKTGIEKPTGKTPPKAVSVVTKEIGGIPQEGNKLGSPKAPVTLVYFGDLECPICKDFTLGALPKLFQKSVRPGKLRIEYRNLETATREPETFRTQQVAALAAGKQNKGWYYIELFYNQQGQEDSEYVNEQYLRTLAEQTPGLNLTDWTAARSEPAFTNTITSDAQAANNAGFTGTPSFQIGKTGGPVSKLEYQSLTDPSGFESAIDKLL